MKTGFTLLFLLTMFSCAVNVRDAESDFSENKLPSENETKLLSEFETETLDKEVIKAFQERAEEKTLELFELLVVIGNQRYDEDLRGVAKKTCLSFFADENISVHLSGEEIKLKDWLDKIYAGELPVEMIQGKDAVETVSQTTSYPYTGKIRFSLDSQTTVGTISTALIKTTKPFGEEKKSVWEVFFTGLEIK